MTKPDPLHLDQQLCFALYSTSLAVTKMYKPLLESLNITYPQYLVLLVLWEKDGIPLKELARRLHQDPGAMTPIVKRLEGMGLLARRRAAKDERNLAIELTEAGRDLKRQARKVNAEIVKACDMSGDEMVELRTALIQLRDQIAR
ncbi:MarR family transcriptional regulator [Sulfidibacter corallicola]|uniref:MarR family transcriptional regulator n=1 Tax=Sulfidibacter corallicola TaxID=2818388 RepID=A0A8A4TGW1_SULCO|nr:MarR family transcriptional regulator [Sulfidibacter corallicola]QTD48444.1 MarR family transcriptional regulator [Sulfidibacter corallicola]